MVLFVLGSALCGTARTLPALVLYRILQGFGGGALQPTQQAILRQTFPPEEQGIAMAMFSMVIMIGPAVGPVLGGFITDNYSWPWIFYINLPVGIIGIMMTLQNVHEPEDVRIANRARAETARKNLDIAGIVLMVVGVGALQYLFEEGPQDDWFDSMEIRIAAFVARRRARRLRHPRAHRDRAGRQLADVQGHDVHVRDGHRVRDVRHADGQHVPVAGVRAGEPALHRDAVGHRADAAHARDDGGVADRRQALQPDPARVHRRGRRGPVRDRLVAAVEHHARHLGARAGLPLVITGAAFACLFVPLTTAALSRTPRHLMADAAGLNSFVRQIGGSIGLTIFATMFTNYAVEARAGVARNLTMLRPEVASHFAAHVAGGTHAPRHGCDQRDDAAPAKPSR